MRELYDEDPQKVASFTDEIFQNEQKFKQTWAIQARRNVAFANGDQNPNPTSAPSFVNNQPNNTNLTSENRQNVYQTNEIEPIIRTLTSYMTREKGNVNVYAGDDDQGKNVAKITDKVLDAKYVLDNEQTHAKNASFWSLTTGTVFAKDYWDYSLGSYLYELDPNTGNVALDPQTGEPIIAAAKSGNNNVAMITGMTLTVDQSVTDFEQQPFVGESYVMDVDWAREAFDQDLPGFTGKAHAITEDGYTATTVQILESMKFAIPYISSGAGMVNSVNGKSKCLVQEWNIRPNRQFRRGRLLIKAGNVVVYDSYNQGQDVGNPYFMELETIMWHPYSMFQYEPYVGRFLGKSLVEQLVPLQMRLNEINGAILENANTIAKPNIMACIGQLKKGIMNGRGSNIYTYQQIPGAPPPFNLQGAPLPAQFFNERQMLVDEMVRISGTNFVMQGQAPSGVTAASAIQQLLENANTQHSLMMQNWETFLGHRATKKIRVIHRFHEQPDEQLNRYIKTLCKDALETEIHDFIGTKDLSEEIVVRIEPGSTIPKSTTAKNQSYQELAKAGMLGNVAMDPELQAQLLEKVGLEPLTTPQSIEKKKAKWENDNMIKGQPMPISPFDVAAIHIPCHLEKIQDPSFIEVYPQTSPQYQILSQHIQAHQMAEAQKAQQAMMAQGGMPPAGGQPGPQMPPTQGPAAPQILEGSQSLQ